jgi:hypothetical protein
LAAVGIQDQFLTGDPDVTYFIKKFTRHTKFAIETINCTFDQSSINFGSLLTCTIPRNGQLIRNIYLKIVLPALTINEDLLNPRQNTYTTSIGHALIEYADLLIGNQTVERINGEYLHIMSQSGLSDSQQAAMEYLVGDTTVSPSVDAPSLTTHFDIYRYDPTLVYGLGPATTTTNVLRKYPPYPRTFLIPLSFYFMRSESLSIPLVALTRQEVQVRIKFRELNQLIAGGVTVNPNGVTPLTPFQASLPVEYVYLGDDEINYIQKSKIDYVITQLQLNEIVVPPNVTQVSNWQLYFINPVKEMFILIQDSNVVTQNNDYFNYYNNDYVNGLDQLVNVQLQFNWENMLDPTVSDSLYLGNVQFMNNHTRMPNANMRIYNYSFAIDPENYLPTGQVNFSRILNQLLTVNLTPSTRERNVRVYAKSYNILRIQNGLAGCLFMDNNFI